MKRKAPKVRETPSKTRVSVSFPVEHYNALQEEAVARRVSVAWVVREAVGRYLGAGAKTGGQKR